MTYKLFGRGESPQVVSPTGKKRDWVRTLLLFLGIVLLSFMMRTYQYNTAVESLNEQIGEVPQAERVHLPAWKRFFPVRHNNFSPFTIESAMMFGYAQDIALGRGVPAHDERLKHMEDIPPYAQMNMGLEWFLGWGWRLKNMIVPDPEATPREKLFQDYPYMQQWMSAQIRLWISTVSGLIFLWLLLLKCPPRLAFAGGFLHAVSPAAIARATGQDLVRGEFCIPLIVASIVLVQWICDHPRWWKYLLLFFATFLAFVSWDLCQMLYSCWGLAELLRYACGGQYGKPRFISWCTISAAVLLNALVVPFNVQYGLIHAPLLWAVLPTVLLCYAYERLFLRRRVSSSTLRAWLRVAPFVLFLLLYMNWRWIGNTPDYASNYSHFGEVMKAKLRFNNVKPANSARLNFDARIMWTPSMHSATWDIATTFFPSFVFGNRLNFGLFRFVFGKLPLTLSFFALLLVAVSLFRLPRQTFLKSLPRSVFPTVFTVGFIVGFIYIVRYHEFVILFLSVSLPLLLQSYLRAFRHAPAKVVPYEAYTALYAKPKFMKFVRRLLVTVFVFLLTWEFLIALASRRRYTGDVALRETAQLIMWFRTARDHVAAKGVAGTMTIEPMLFAYAGTGVVMNPQFGMKRLRDCTEDYLHVMFHGSELDIAKYCGEHDVKYIVYNKGMTFSRSINSNRYIANALDISTDCPAYEFLNKPDSLSWFCRVAPPAQLASVNRVYTVFQYISPKDKQDSLRLCLTGRQEMAANNRKSAAECARQAVELDPNSEEAIALYFDTHGDYPTLSLNGVK